MRPAGRVDADRVTGADGAARHHHAHDPGPAHHGPVRVAPQHRSEQPRAEGVDLRARVAQPGHLDDRRAAEVQASARRQRQQVDAADGLSESLRNNGASADEVRAAQQRARDDFVLTAQQMGATHAVESMEEATELAKQFTNAELKAIASYVGSLESDLHTVPQSRFR